MRKFLLIPVVIVASLGILRAQDELHMKDGTVREGRLSGVEGNLYRLSLPGPAPGQSGGTTTIPRDSVEKIVFGPDAVLDAIKANRLDGGRPRTMAGPAALPCHSRIPCGRGGKSLRRDPARVGRQNPRGGSLGHL